MSYNSSRRKILRTFLSLGVTAALPRAHAETNVDNLENIASHVKTLAARTKGSSLRLLYPEGCVDNLRPVVAVFTQATGVRVELVAGSLEFIGSEIRFNHSVRDGSKTFDLAIPATYSLPDMIGEGLLQDLSEYREKHEPARLREEMLYSLGDFFDGGFYGYQTDGDAYLAFYNHGLPQFEASAARYADAHGEALAAPRTWAELDTQLKHFHQPDKGVFGGTLYRTKRYVAWEYWSRLHAKGLLPVTDDFVPQFNTDEGVAALDELIAASRWLSPDTATNGLFDNFQSYAEGNAFINLGWGGTQKFLQGDSSKVQGQLRHSVLPGGLDVTGQPFDAPIFNWGWNFVVPQGSTNAELGYLFSLFATLPAMSTMSVQQQGGYFDPHQHSHYDDPVIANIYGESFLDAHHRSITRCIPDFHVYHQERYMRILGEAIYAATRGHLRADVSMREAAKQWQQLTDQTGRDKQIQQWDQLKNSYPSHILAVKT